MQFGPLCLPGDAEHVTSSSYSAVQFWNRHAEKDAQIGGQGPVQGQHTKSVGPVAVREFLSRCYISCAGNLFRGSLLQSDLFYFSGLLYLILLSLVGLEILGSRVQTRLSSIHFFRT
jgi:hypothetical protein